MEGNLLLVSEMVGTGNRSSSSYRRSLFYYLRWPDSSFNFQLWEDFLYFYPNLQVEEEFSVIESKSYLIPLNLYGQIHSWDLHGVFWISMLLRCSLHASNTIGNHMYVQCFLFLLCPYYLSNKVFNCNLYLTHLALLCLTCLPGDEANFLYSYVPNCYNLGCPIRSCNPCPQIQDS